jgi:hypothetical protein
MDSSVYVVCEKERKENDIQRAASFSLVAMSRPTDFFIGLEFAG